MANKINISNVFVTLILLGILVFQVDLLKDILFEKLFPKYYLENKIIKLEESINRHKINLQQTIIDYEKIKITAELDRAKNGLISDLYKKDKESKERYIKLSESIRERQLNDMIKNIKRLRDKLEEEKEELENVRIHLKKLTNL